MSNKSLLGVGIIFILFFTVSCHRHKADEERYAKMPPELAALYIKIDKHPSDPVLYAKLSDYYLKTSVMDSALNAILTAIRLDSSKSDFYLKLSDVYFAMNNIDASEEMLDKVIAMDAKNQEAYLKLAELHFLHKRYKEAHETIDKVLEIDTYNPKAYFIRAWVYRKEGDTTAAIRSYLTAVDQKNDYYEAYEELALLYHHKKDPTVINYYKNALNIKPNNTQIMYNLAMFYQETGDFDKAILYYKMIIQIDPSHKYALHNIGWIYLVKMQKYDEAVAFFTKAINVDNNYLEAIYNRGLAFESLKKYNNARQDYEYTLKLNDKYQVAIEGLNRLDKLQKN